MSKLSDLIKRVSRGEPAPLGFAPGVRKPVSSMVLVALVSGNYAKDAAEAAAAGADVVVLTGKPGDKDIAEAVAAADGRACGVLADASKLSSLRDAKVDFAVLSPDAPASVLHDEDLGFILHLQEEFNDVQLRTVDSMGFEAIYVEYESAALTIRRLMELQRVSGLTRLPLLVRVRADATQDDLLSLRNSGTALPALDMKERGADGLRTLRAVIDTLPRRRRRRDDSEVTLPTASTSHEHEEADDDDE